ncbi:diaminopimelate decarboxylase [Ferrimonas balearica]|uniref:diaminopimelate decarboxylase n=1 Tax=Ferrimonas balearica TaxID=44012 RepID=UPI001C58E131|nr:diaminopimelate decarboxylase [Ferrimonas balearica]MBW3141410.1 diaminopimelate decarboxylase [Ferrimonas balearica]MBW3166424.1 diaminopimelate decarboxylase [Ferrimonas balearica]MBY5982169.1 diaminopimelate decarboxylase [Ferrimonas balearica]MBY6108454.1 diaminopimelate decarboxylase [Ferrimonas balearica]
MDHFSYRQGALCAEEVPLAEVAAAYGTPCYVYSRATIERHFHAFDRAVGDHPHLICYAVKANSNLAVLNLLARLGSGFDIVSGGELARVIQAGGDPGKVVFSGVGKTADEMRQALQAGIYCFNVESEAELERLNEVAGAMGLKAPVSLRINPDVDAGTHPYISTGLKENKFGIAMARAEQVFQRAASLPNLLVKGADCHIGSQLTTLPPFIDALDRLLALVDRLAELGIVLSHLDVGGGLGVRYDEESPPLPDEYARALREHLGNRPLTLILEPGRAIMANAGVLLTEVAYLKTGEDRHFAIVDAAMNDLIRPSLYSAWQAIIPVEPRDGPHQTYDVVGPVCETGDFLGKGRELCIEPGDLLAVRSSGAYGFTMASNYNSRPRAAEVMVDGDAHHLIRARETVEQLWQGESLLP